MIYNNDDPSVGREFTRGQFICIEEICMKAVKISLELAIVPIRKFLIIFFIYIRLLFGRKVHPPVKIPRNNKPALKETDIIKKYRHLLYLKDY